MNEAIETDLAAAAVRTMDRDSRLRERVRRGLASDGPRNS